MKKRSTLTPHYPNQQSNVSHGVNKNPTSETIVKKIMENYKQADKMLCEYIGSTIKKQLEDQPSCHDIKYDVNNNGARVKITFNHTVVPDSPSSQYQESVTMIAIPGSRGTCDILTQIKRETGQTASQVETITIDQIQKYIELHQDNHECNSPNIEESSSEEEKEDIKNIKKKNHYAEDKDKKNNYLKTIFSTEHIDGIAIDGYDNQHQEDKSSDEEDEGVADIRNLKHTTFHSSILNNK